jgi:radical SAM protein (TIGR01212 family)
VRPSFPQTHPKEQQLAQLVNTLGQALLQRYGERVHKVALDIGFTCPNRDGTRGWGGCTFCNNESFAPATRERPSLPEQIRKGSAVVAKRTGARKTLAYFQAYTNTYDALEILESQYRLALSQEGVIGLSVGTRPDCLGPGVLELLAQIQDEGYEVWLELGLQSANNATLERINRGHTWEEYASVIPRIQALDLKLCTHLILGLPGEGREEALQTHRKVLEYGVQGLKIHPLHVVRSSILAAQWKRGDYQPLSLSDYVCWTADLIERTPPDIIFHRLTGTCETALLLAPSWCDRKWDVLNGIEAELRERGSWQGSQTVS